MVGIHNPKNIHDNMHWKPGFQLSNQSLSNPCHNKQKFMDTHQGENSKTGKRKRKKKLEKEKENHKQGKKKSPKLEKEIKIQKLELEKTK